MNKEQQRLLDRRIFARRIFLADVERISAKSGSIVSNLYEMNVNTIRFML